jgi:carboxymethylenebutenolidase
MTTDNKPGNGALWEEEIVIARPGGSLPIFCAGPDDKEPHPAIILVHEIFGLNEHIKDVARRFARESYVVYAPDLFAYSNLLPRDHNDLQGMRAAWASIRDDQLINDLQAVFAQARISRRVEPRAIGTLGYCMGGAIAYLFACRTPLLAWVVSYYGRIYYQDITECKPRHPISYTGGLHCPFLGIFAGIDDLILAEQIGYLQQKLVELGKKFQLKVYDSAKHAFFNDQREFYHYEAAADAWKLTLSFIEAQTRRDQ